MPLDRQGAGATPGRRGRPRQSLVYVSMKGEKLLGRFFYSTETALVL